MAQKKKKKKLNFKRLIVFLLLIYLIIAGVLKILNEPIRNIIITGNYFVSDNDIINAAGIKNYPAIAKLNISKIKKQILENPLISEVEIKRNLRFQLKIKVKELKVICLDRPNDVILLEDGSKIEKSPDFLGIPTLINYTKEDVLKEFLKGMGALDYGTISGISEIEYAPSKSANENIVDDTRFLLKMNDGNSVYINIYKLNNLKYYQKIYASLNNKKGILHLDSGSYLEEVK